MITQEWATSASGRLLSHYHFESGTPGVRRRRIYVYLPQAYADHPKRRFPVLRLLDGQHTMDLPGSVGGGWKVNLALERLAEKGLIDPPLLVAIGNSGMRLREYMGWSDEPDHHHPSGEKHCDYVVSQVIPFIESHYRVSRRVRNRFIAGASAGGVAALYLALSHPKVFYGVGSISAGRHFFAELARRFIISGASTPRLFLSCGTRGMDEELNPHNREFAGHLKEVGVDFVYVERERASHNERCWAAVVPEMLQFFFSP